MKNNYVKLMLFESSFNIFVFASMVILIYKLQGLFLATSTIALLVTFKTILGLFYPFLTSLKLRNVIFINIIVSFILYFIILWSLDRDLDELSIIVLSCFQSLETAVYQLKVINDTDFVKGSKRVLSLKQTLNNIGILFGSSLIALFSKHYSDGELLYFLSYGVLFSNIFLFYSIYVLRRIND